MRVNIAIGEVNGTKEQTFNKTVSNSPIDIDIIFYGRESISNAELTVPHPRWRERDFVKTPLLDLLACGAFDCEEFSDLKAEISEFSKMFEPFGAF